MDSDDRGDFVLHPEPFHLVPGESMTLEWEITALPHGALKETLLSRPGFCMVSFEQETVFPDETFELTVEGDISGKAEVFLQRQRCAVPPGRRQTARKYAAAGLGRTPL